MGKLGPAKKRTVVIRHIHPDQKMTEIEAPNCARCGHEVDSFEISREHDTDDIKMIARCHGGMEMVRVSQRDILRGIQLGEAFNYDRSKKERADYLEVPSPKALRTAILSYLDRFDSLEAQLVGKKVDDLPQQGSVTEVRFPKHAPSEIDRLTAVSWCAAMWGKDSLIGSYYVPAIALLVAKERARWIDAGRVEQRLWEQQQRASEKASSRRGFKMQCDCDYAEGVPTRGSIGDATPFLRPCMQHEAFANAAYDRAIADAVQKVMNMWARVTGDTEVIVKKIGEDIRTLKKEE